MLQYSGLMYPYVRTRGRFSSLVHFIRDIGLYLQRPPFCPNVLVYMDCMYVFKVGRSVTGDTGYLLEVAG